MVVQSARCTPANHGTSARTASASAPPVNRTRAGAVRGRRSRLTVGVCAARSRRGNTSSTTKSTRKGTAGGRPASTPDVNHFVDSDASTPMTRPPTKASGRLRNAPSAAAPKAWTTSRVNKMGSSGSNGANSRPASAAHPTPIIHARPRTRAGLVPASSSSCGSSTSARIAAPVRVMRRKR